MSDRALGNGFKTPAVPRIDEMYSTNRLSQRLAVLAILLIDCVAAPLLMVTGPQYPVATLVAAGLLVLLHPPLFLAIGSR